MFIKMRRTAVRVGDNESRVQFGRAKFEILIRHPHENIKEAAEYMSRA